MTSGQLEILGVYRLHVTPALLKRQFAELYGNLTSEAQRRHAKRQCKQQLESVVLIEVLVNQRDDRFRVRDFTQPRDGVPRDSWQAAWAEAYLTADGESRLVMRSPQLPTNDTFRCAFFLHFYQPDKPLLTSYGTFNCPPVEDMPKRLAQLVPFIPVD